MRKPFAIPVTRAFPAINTAESRITPWVITLARFVCRAYLASFIGNARVYLDEKAAGIFIPAMERALSLKSRCIIAFRHQNGWEPQVLMWFTLYRLNRLARKHGVRFPLPPRLRFVHGYELFCWGGPLARFMLPRFGAMPVHHVKRDRAGLDRMYNCLREGPYPLAIAPEGQVSYTLAEEPRIEPGAVRIGLSAAEQLLKQVRTDEVQTSGENCPTVEILPVSLYPEYSGKALKQVDRLVRHIERICGIDNGTLRSSKPSASTLALPELNTRLLRCRERILALNEKRYNLTQRNPGQDEQSFSTRLDALIEKALQSAAAILRIENPTGTAIDRLYIIRQTCWDRIFIENTTPDALPALERALVDIRAGEAWYASRHMELADFSLYFHKPPPASSAPDIAALIAPLVEYTQNLYDFANRTMGGTYNTRRRIAPKSVRITTARPIDLTAMLLTDDSADAMLSKHRKTVSAKANKALKEQIVKNT
ncbi:MAG: acyltransferase [Treponema sp.]|jgi:1-acyl-sn-glycerol-3-phosphate acyltransferase|nr:acyltransferase [Treponema sp.]